MVVVLVNIGGGVAVGKEIKTMLKMLKEAGFVLTLHSDFLILNVWNPPLFTMGEKKTLYFYWGQILALDSTGKDPDHLLKGVIID